MLFIEGVPLYYALPEDQSNYDASLPRHVENSHTLTKKAPQLLRLGYFYTSIFTFFYMQ